jgi:hypothetical protein
MMSSEADLEENMPSEEMLVDEVRMEKETPTGKELSREQKVLLPAGGTLHQTRDDIHVSPNGKTNKTYFFIDDGNINGVIRNEFYPSSPTLEPGKRSIYHNGRWYQCHLQCRHSVALQQWEAFLIR